MAQAGIQLNLGGLAKAAAKLRGLSTTQLERVSKRGIATLQRRLVPEAARLLSQKVLNLQPRQISPYLGTELSGDTLILRGSKKRLPLSDFGATWGGSTTAGAVATLWRDAGPKTFLHTFKIKGKKQVWQRVPYSGAKFNSRKLGRGTQSAAPSGLVQQYPIIVRKGPSFSRAVIGKRHGDIYPDLIRYSNDLLATEIRRLLDAELK